MLGTIAMSPASKTKTQGGPGKYKYIFRVCLNAKYFVGYLIGAMKHLNEQFGFNKVFIMNQDVAWARATADIMTKISSKKPAGRCWARKPIPPASSDFSAGLMKARAKGAQVILPVFDMPQSGILVKQWKAMKVPALMAGFISPLAGPGAWKTFDGKIGGALNAIFELGNIPPKSIRPPRTSTTRTEKNTGSPSSPATVRRPPMNRCICWRRPSRGPDRLDPDKIVDALEKTDQQGVMGCIKFDKGNQVIYGNDPQKEAIGVRVPVDRRRQAGHCVSRRPSPKRPIQLPGFREIGQIARIV